MAEVMADGYYCSASNDFGMLGQGRQTEARRSPRIGTDELPLAKCRIAKRHPGRRSTHLQRSES